MADNSEQGDNTDTLSFTKIYDTMILIIYLFLNKSCQIERPKQSASESKYKQIKFASKKPCQSSMLLKLSYRPLDCIFRRISLCPRPFIAHYFLEAAISSLHHSQASNPETSQVFGPLQLCFISTSTQIHVRPQNQPRNRNSLCPLFRSTL